MSHHEKLTNPHLQQGKLARVWLQTEADRHEPPEQLISIEFKGDDSSAQGFSCRATDEALRGLLEAFLPSTPSDVNASQVMVMLARQPELLDGTLDGLAAEAIRQRAPVGAGPPILGFRNPDTGAVWLPRLRHEKTDSPPERLQRVADGLDAYAKTLDAAGGDVARKSVATDVALFARMARGES